MAGLKRIKLKFGSKVVTVTPTVIVHRWEDSFIAQKASSPQQSICSCSIKTHFSQIFYNICRAGEMWAVQQQWKWPWKSLGSFSSALIPMDHIGLWKEFVFWQHLLLLPVLDLERSRTAGKYAVMQLLTELYQGEERKGYAFRTHYAFKTLSTKLLVWDFSGTNEYIWRSKIWFDINYRLVVWYIYSFICMYMYVCMYVYT